MEQEKNKKNIGRTVMEVIMVIIIILLTVTSIVFGIGDNSGPPPFPPGPGPQPKPQPSPWDRGSTTFFSEFTMKKIEAAKEKVDKQYDNYLNDLPDKYDTVHITYNKIFNLGDYWGNDIDLGVINHIARDKKDNSLTITTKLSINQSVRNDDIYLVGKTHTLGDRLYGDDVIELWDHVVVPFSKVFTNKAGDQTKLENRVFDLVFFEKPLEVVKGYNLVVNNNEPTYNDNDIVKDNKLFNNLSNAKKISVRVNLINEFNPRYKLIIE